ncbi:ketoacyl-ACP synthase III [bacterium]|nr:ketoacyl-ACP synthase III [bacterium]
MINNAIPLRIAGVGYSVPKTVITNEDLTKLYDTSDVWIYSRTGIKERRIVSGNEGAFELGVEAAKKALSKSGIKSEDIEMIIVATSAPSQLYPAMGCRIQAALEIPNNIPAFDITAACSGLIYALSIARGYIASGMYKNILIVATDNNSKLLDWSDRTCSILFGDGAGAMVVTASDDGVDDIISIDIKSDGSIGDIIQLNLTGKNCPLVEPNEEQPLFIKMNGKEVYRFVARVLPEYVEKLIADAGMKAEDIDYLIPHQANLRIIQAVQERLGYSDEKVITNIKYYGNTSAASIPLAMVEGVENGKVKLGSTAILTGFGAGMTWGGCIVRLREGIC